MLFSFFSFAADVHAQRAISNSRAAQFLKSGIGSKPANISADSDNALSGIQSKTFKELFHITRRLNSCAPPQLLPAISIPRFYNCASRARIIIGVRSVTSPSLRNVGTRFLTTPEWSFFPSGFGPIATMDNDRLDHAKSQIFERDNNNQRPVRLSVLCRIFGVAPNVRRARSNDSLNDDRLKR